MAPYAVRQKGEGEGEEEEGEEEGESMPEPWLRTAENAKQTDGEMDAPVKISVDH